MLATQALVYCVALAVPPPSHDVLQQVPCPTRGLCLHTFLMAPVISKSQFQGPLLCDTPPDSPVRVTWIDQALAQLRSPRLRPSTFYHAHSTPHQLEHAVFSYASVSSVRFLCQHLFLPRPHPRHPPSTGKLALFLPYAAHSLTQQEFEPLLCSGHSSGCWH